MYWTLRHLWLRHFLPLEHTLRWLCLHAILLCIQVSFNGNFFSVFKKYDYTMVAHLSELNIKVDWTNRCGLEDRSKGVWTTVGIQKCFWLICCKAECQYSPATAGVHGAHKCFAQSKINACNELLHWWIFIYGAHYFRILGLSFENNYCTIFINICNYMVYQHIVTYWKWW